MCILRQNGVSISQQKIVAKSYLNSWNWHIHCVKRTNQEKQLFLASLGMIVKIFLSFSLLLASSISKIGSDPLKLVHDAVEETTDWVYGFFSLLSDIISSDGDEEDDDGDEDTDKGTKSIGTYLTARTNTRYAL